MATGVVGAAADAWQPRCCVGTAAAAAGGGAWGRARPHGTGTADVKNPAGFWRLRRPRVAGAIL